MKPNTFNNDMYLIKKIQSPERYPEIFVYEDELPEMTKSEYDEWFLTSFVHDGVRMSFHPKYSTTQTDFTEKEVVESQPEIESDIEKGNDILLKKFGTQERVDKYLKQTKDILRKKFEDSGHLPKD